MNSFMIVANGRTGSTWLMTSLDQLPDAVCRREFKWRPRLYVPQSVHCVIEDSNDRIDRHLRVLQEEFVHDVGRLPAAVGSKLVYDPYYYHVPELISVIFETLGAQTRTLLLQRDYLETFISWKSRGVHHELDLRAEKINGRTPDPTLINAIGELGPDSHRQRRIILTRDGRPLDDVRPADGDVVLDVLEAVDFCLMLFCNDIYTADRVLKRGGMIVRYLEIAEKFREITRYVGSAASEPEIEGVLAQPLTRKLAGPLAGTLHPHALISELATCLQQGFEQLASGRRSAQDIWRWSKDYVTAEISLPGLRSLIDFARGRRSSRMLSFLGTRNAVWKPRRLVRTLVCE